MTKDEDHQCMNGQQKDILCGGILAFVTWIIGIGIMQLITIRAMGG